MMPTTTTDSPNKAQEAVSTDVPSRDPFQLIKNSVTLPEAIAKLDLGSINSSKKFFCPHHDDRRGENPNAHYFEDAERYHCFNCGTGGDVIDLWAAGTGTAPGAEAVYSLGEAFGINLPERDPELERRVKERRDWEAAYLMGARELYEALGEHAPEVRRPAHRAGPTRARGRRSDPHRRRV